jgi:predicted small metal-binding protein
MSSINKINELLRKIQEGIYSQHKLNVLYKNAVDNKYPEVQLAVQDALRQIGGSQYTKKFLQPIRSKVQDLVQEIAVNNDWLKFDSNQVKNGLKVGGGMIRGDAIAQYYISCKQLGWKRSISFAATQADENSEIFYSVASPGLMEEIHLKNAEDAIGLFKSELQEQMQ